MQKVLWGHKESCLWCACTYPCVLWPNKIGSRKDKYFLLFLLWYYKPLSNVTFSCTLYSLIGSSPCSADRSALIWWIGTIENGSKTVSLWLHNFYTTYRFVRNKPVMKRETSKVTPISKANVNRHTNVDLFANDYIGRDVAETQEYQC